MSDLPARARGARPVLGGGWGAGGPKGHGGLNTKTLSGQGLSTVAVRLPSRCAVASHSISGPKRKKQAAESLLRVEYRVNEERYHL